MLKMKKKIFIMAIAVAIFSIIIILIHREKAILSTDEIKSGEKLTLSINEIKFGEVRRTVVGTSLEYKFFYKELKEFVDFFNRLGIRESDLKKISGSHTTPSVTQPMNVILYMNNDKCIYYTAFKDGEIYITNDYEGKSYSIYNDELVSYIYELWKYLT